MNQRDLDRISDLLLEIGGRTPWVLLWDEAANDGHPSLLSSAEPREVPQMVCSHLLRMLRGELGAEDAVVVEH